MFGDCWSPEVHTRNVWLLSSPELEEVYVLLLDTLLEDVLEDNEDRSLVELLKMEESV